MHGAALFLLIELIGKAWKWEANSYSAAFGIATSG